MCPSSIHGARDPATDGSSLGGILALGVLDEPRCSRELTHFCSLATERRTLGALRKREYPDRGRRSMADRTVPVVHSDPEIMGGTPVFVGTRVPFQTLLDYLEAGDPLGEFLDDFPTVSRDQAIAALEQAKDALIARAHTA